MNKKRETILTELRRQFGSHARGDAVLGSDLDVLVVLKTLFIPEMK
jgi:predicted nucleotidyltransferase